MPRKFQGIDYIQTTKPDPGFSGEDNSLIANIGRRCAVPVYVAFATAARERGAPPRSEETSRASAVCSSASGVTAIEFTTRVTPGASKATDSAVRLCKPSSTNPFRYTT